MESKGHECLETGVRFDAGACLADRDGWEGLTSGSRRFGRTMTVDVTSVVSVMLGLWSIL